VQSASGAPAGTQITATASCPAGKHLLGGGALTGTTGGGAVGLVMADYPSSVSTLAGTWTATALVAANNPGGGRTTIQAFALCSV
jgi:hypothetical protein